ncbi:beta-1,6-N-acetylglucosaminyltransferase [Clostridium autoethanogenum]|uniref:beta-1,6-N-acetylglucosaminyltransferase n=1 Tax=Clostridium autoethanogenum TaxID=84023 RepID=UPI001604FAFC|nr:beta-1,6-N-acetylglucosaminyltransferase [Clostridium autoethanogenum]
MNRLKNSKLKIYYGSQWFSITNNFAHYVINNENLIQKLFRFTSCSDELVMQTLIMKSPYKDNLYIKERINTTESNMRLIDWSRGENGSPYVWKNEDYNTLKTTTCLFARKFDSNFSREYELKLVKTLF